MEGLYLTLMGLLPVLLVVQGVLGGVDTLVNHELIEHLPRRIEARPELALHALREANYGVLFAGLAWYAWHGTYAVVIGALLAGQILVDACDEAVENRIRVLPQNERVLHFLLTLNLGVIAAVLTPLLFAWAARPTGLALAGHGILTWVLSGLALASAAWSVRDFLAWRALSRLRA
jgi:hypothetical protein